MSTTYSDVPCCWRARRPLASRVATHRVLAIKNLDSLHAKDKFYYRGQCINKVDISLNIKQKQKNNAMQPLQPHQLGNGIFMCLILGCSTGSIMLTVKKNDYVKDKRYLFEACSG